MSFLSIREDLETSIFLKGVLIYVLGVIIVIIGCSISIILGVKLLEYAIHV